MTEAAADRQVPARLLYNAREATSALSISERKLWELTNRGEIPCVRIGRAVRYARQDLELWVQQHKCGRPLVRGGRS